MSLIAAALLAVQLHGPFTPPPRPSAPVAAATQHGIVVAWSEIPRGSRLATIHTALFDLDANPIGPIHQLPATRANVHATSPVIATNGERHVIAWLEHDRFSTQPVSVAGTMTDHEGAPLIGTEWLGDPVPGAPSLVWNGVDFRVYGGGTHTISPDGEVRKIEFGVVPQRLPFATPDANGWIDWTPEPGRPPCLGLCGGIIGSPPSLVVDFAVISWDWIRSGRVRDTGYTIAAAPAVTGEADDLLAVWGYPQGLKGLRIIDGEPRPIFTRTDPRARDAVLSIAGPVAVFESAFDIYGVTVSGEAFSPLFPIATGDDLQSHPRVLRIGTNRYFVTWLENNSRILAAILETTE